MCFFVQTNHTRKELLSLMFKEINLRNHSSLHKLFYSLYLNGNSYTDMCTRYVKVIKPIRVYKVRTGTCEAKNKFHKYGKIKKGAKIWISHYLMSTGGGWVVISAHKYYSTRRIFFFAANGHARANWYRRIA